MSDEELDAVERRLRAAFHDAASQIHGGRDAARLADRARRRRRARRGWLVGIAAVGVLAVVGATKLVTTDDSDDPGVAVSTPVVVRNTAALATITVPDGWRELTAFETTAPTQLMVVGTTERPEGVEPIRACDGPTPSELDGAFVSIYEYLTGDQLISPDGQTTYDAATFVSRPPDFSQVSSIGSSCGDAAGNIPIPEPGVAIEIPAPPAVAPFTAEMPTSPEATTTTLEPPPLSGGLEAEYPFIESGRFFIARVVAAGSDVDDRFADAISVLNGLDIGLPPEATTTTSAGTPVTTAVVPADDQAAAEQGITDALRGAFGGGGPLTSDTAIIGGLPFGDDAAPRLREEKREFIGVIVPRVNWLNLTSPTHAVVNFDLLIDGRTITANTTGEAIKTDGVWQIPVSVFCEIAHRGGVACPAP